mmetsp:Transcript_8028/g.29186  ORF Transcript_8028/g.29186 Transcript_8028/m.29186 type:complete len:494 (-) Transcript_8028:227-1708(-)
MSEVGVVAEGKDWAQAEESDDDDDDAELDLKMDPEASEVGVVAEAKDWAQAEDSDDDDDADLKMERHASDVFQRRACRLAAAEACGGLQVAVPVAGEEVQVVAQGKDWAEAADSDQDDGCLKMQCHATDVFKRRESRIAIAAEQAQLERPFFLKPSVGTWMLPLPESGPCVASSSDAAAATEARLAGLAVDFHHLPSVGTWRMAKRLPLLPSSSARGAAGLPRSALGSIQAVSSPCATCPKSPKSAIAKAGGRAKSPASGGSMKLQLPTPRAGAGSSHLSPPPLVTQKCSGLRSPSFAGGLHPGEDSPVSAQDAGTPPKERRTRRTSSGFSSEGGNPGNEATDRLDGLSSNRLATQGPKVVGTGPAQFRVAVPNPYPGVQYRKTMNLEDKWPRFAQNGLIVKGTIVDGGWLRLEQNVFLPMRVGAIEILTRQEPDGTESQSLTRSVARSATQDFKEEVPWWMVWCSVCSSSASTESEVIVTNASQNDVQCQQR